MEGWIKLHRSIKESILWNSSETFDKRSAWIDIILSANHADNEFLLGNQKVKVERGSFITSEKKLMGKWKWSKSKVRNYLKLLESENMIVKNSDTKKTTLTVVNYSVYQDKQTTKEPAKDFKKTSKELQKDTNNNVNNEKNDNIKIVFDYFTSKKIINHKTLSDEFKKDISKVLKEYDIEDIKNTIDRYSIMYEDKNYIYCNYKWGIHEFFTRKEGYKRFLDDGAKWSNYLGVQTKVGEENKSDSKFTPEQIAEFKRVKEERNKKNE